MNLAEQIYQAVKPLSMVKAQEVLDFALFLQQREDAQEWQNLMLAQVESLSDWDNPEDEAWNNVQFSKMAMNQAMRGMENEPALYESLADDEQNTQQLLEMIKNIKPVTCEYSSEQIVRSLRDGTPLA